MRAWLPLLLLGLLGLGGCGWHAGLEAPGDARSIGVEVFDIRRQVLERDLQPELHQELTRALIDLAAADIASPSEADLIVRGQILEYRRRGGIRNEDNQLRESGVYFAASAQLVDRRTGLVVVPERRAGIWSGYVITDTESVPHEDEAKERALRHVAETLILDLLTPTEEEAASPAPKGA